VTSRDPARRSLAGSDAICGGARRWRARGARGRPRSCGVRHAARARGGPGATGVGASPAPTGGPALGPVRGCLRAGRSASLSLLDELRRACMYRVTSIEKSSLCRISPVSRHRT